MLDFFEVGKGDMDSICFYKAENFVPKSPLDLSDIYALRYYATFYFADTEYETWQEFDRKNDFYDGELYLNRSKGLLFGLPDEECNVWMATLRTVSINESGRPAVDIWFSDTEHYWYWFE